MAITYSPILKLNIITTGTEDNTWGDITNTNLGVLLEEAIAGTAIISVTGGDVTLSDNNGATDEARCMAIRVQGFPGVTRNIIAPALSKMYVVGNGSDSNVVFKTSTSTGVTVPSGEVYLLFFDTVLLDFVLVGKSFTSTNIGNTLVLRDASGNFAANVITANTFSGQLNGTISSTTTATTQTAGDSTTKVATTEFVTDAIADKNLGTISTQNADNVNISGGALAGVTLATTSSGNSVNGNVVGSNATGAKTVSTSAPTGGNDGDVWYQY